MKAFVVNIELETIENRDYRRVLYTTPRTQLVLMNLKPGEEIGEEVHDLDQFIRLEQGDGIAVLDGDTVEIPENSALIIPEGVRHNIVNTGHKDMRLYTIYTPPEHREGLVQKTKSDSVREALAGALRS